MILGLDISTSIVGYSLISLQNQKLTEHGHIKLPKMEKGKKTIDFVLNETAKEFKTKFDKIISDFDVKAVYIEKPYTFFNSGGSSAHTMSLLIFFNGIVSQYVCNNVCDNIKYVDSKSTKKMLGIKAPKGLSTYKQKKFKKEATIQKVKEFCPEFKIKLTNRGHYIKGLDDEADAISLALYHFSLDNQS